MAVGEIGGIKVTLKADADVSGAVTGGAKITETAKKIQSDFKQIDSAVTKSTNNVNAGMTKLANTSKKLTSQFKFQKGGMAQLGMQIQDVAVMSQYGADKFIILGTQGSQIASMFGPGGALFGALLAIGAAIGGVAFKMNAASKETEDLAQKLRDLSETSKITAEEQAYLTSLNEKDIKGKKERIKAIEDEIKAEQEKLDLMSSAGVGINTSEFAVPKTAAQNQKIYADSIAESSSAVIKLRAELAYLNREVSGGSSEEAVKSENAQIQKRLDNIQSGLDSELEKLQVFKKTRSAVILGMYSEEQAAAARNDIANQQRINANLDATLNRLNEERNLILENQTLTAEEKAARLAEINQAELDADAIHKEQLRQQSLKFQKDMTSIEEAESRRRQAISEREQAAKIRAVSSAFAGLSSLMNTESKKLFEIGKAAAIAGALVDAYAAVAGAYKVGAKIGGPPVGAAFAAAAGVAQAVNIQNIAKQKIGGAQSMGATASYSGGVPAANTQQQGQGFGSRNISISGLDSSSIFSGEQVINLLKEVVGDGADVTFLTGG